MREAIEPHRYIRYLWSCRLWIVASGAIAAAIAAAVSIAMTAEYTATIRIVVEPPAGTDLRAATAVSPIYMESLRTYEQFAASDTLFADAVKRFDLRSYRPRQHMETLKKRVLSVRIVRNTRILEIAATLPSPEKSQALAQFLAESTVALNRSVVGEGNRDLVAGLELQQREIRAEMLRIEDEWAREVAGEPIYSLKAAMEQDESLRLELEHDRIRAEQESAAEAARAVRSNASLLSAAAPRLAQIRAQLEQLTRRIDERERLLTLRQVRRDRLETERRKAQTELAGIEGRLREARSDAGYRGERLRIIDPGIVPEKPSSPNLPLNVIAALLLGLLLPVGYFAFEMQYRPAFVPERSFRAIARAIDD